MKYLLIIKIFLVLLFFVLCFQTAEAQFKVGERKISNLKKINLQSKIQLRKRLELYVEYLKNKQKDNLLKLIINNLESKMAVGLDLITLEINSQPDEFQKAFFKFQKNADDRLGEVLESKISNIAWKLSIHNSSNSDDALFISINFKVNKGKSVFWDKGYWFYGYFYNNEWFFTPLIWADF